MSDTYCCYGMYAEVGHSDDCPTRKSPAALTAAPSDAKWREAVGMAYGYLWCVNYDPGTPRQYPPERAAYEARKLLRDLLTKEERGQYINAVLPLVLGELRAAPPAPTAPAGQAVGAPQRVEAKPLLLDLAAYFRRAGDLWEGPDGCGTPGTDLCQRIAQDLYSLANTPMSLGLTQLPALATPAAPASAPEPQPPNDSGSTICTVRWMVTLPNGLWLGAWDREAFGVYARLATLTAPAVAADRLSDEMRFAIEMLLHKFERAGGVVEVAHRGVPLGAMSWASNVENSLAVLRAAMSAPAPVEAM